MHKCPVTIVTVTYNAEDLVEETILSIINQSHNNIEYIIIDGGSTDGTVDIIKKYEDKIDYWVSEADEGIYYAMNKAIEKASGKYINFMNAGDTFADEDIVKYLMSQNVNNADMIYGNFRIEDSPNVKKALNKSEWLNHMPFCHQTLFARTSIMKDELFDTSFQLAADHNFIIKMYQQDKIFFHVDKLIAIFAPGGFASSNKLLMNIESIKVLFDNNIEFPLIDQSSWYINLQKQSPLYQEKVEWIKTLRVAVKELSSTKFLWHPIKKFKQYKELMSIFHGSKS